MLLAFGREALTPEAKLQATVATDHDLELIDLSVTADYPPQRACVLAARVAPLGS